MFENLNKKISRKFSVVFGIITITVSTSYLLNFWFNSTLKSDSVVIDIAGKNRVIQQEIELGIHKLYFEDNKEEAEKLKATLQELSLVHKNNLKMILDGGTFFDSKENITLNPVTETSIKNEIAEIVTLDKTIESHLPSLLELDKYIYINKVDTSKAKTKVAVINPDFQKGFDKLQFLFKNNPPLKHNQDLLDLLISRADQGKNSFVKLMILLLLTNVSLILFTYIYLRRNLNPIVAITDYVKRLAKGELPEAIKANSQDEIGEIALAVNNLGTNIDAASSFAESIGKGKLDTHIEVFENNGKLANSLMEMRDNLRRVADEEAKRNWSTEGFAKFVDIVRSTDDIEYFYDNVLGSLIKYLGVNQGYLFIVNDENENDHFMEVKAVYAYEKKRYLEEAKVYRFKEGLIGQAWHDRDTLYFTEIPENYVKITSGVGESLPKSLLIVPLINNEKVVGAIEIASFVELEQYVIDFVSKLGETIAGAVANVKVNDRTKKLLADSQEQAEALKAQEEEIRQNMEEMQATQEEMERAQRAMKQALVTAEEKEKEAQALQEEFEDQKNKIQAEFDAQLAIINATAIVSKTDLRGYITYVNDMFCDVAQYTREELLGQNHNIVRHPDMPAAAFEEVWRTISSGNIWTGQVKNKKKDGSHYWVQATISPVIGENGKPVEYMAVRYLITDMKDQEEHTNQMVEEMKAAEEEIRQNIEEMTATQEQMNTVMNEMNAQNNIINSIAIVSKTDVQGNITYVNDEFCKWAKYSREEVMGKNHRILRHPDMPASAFEDLWRTISSGKIWRGEVKNLAKDGSFYWVDAIIAPVRDEKGKIREYIAQRFVINEHKEKEAKMQELLNKLENKEGK